MFVGIACCSTVCYAMSSINNTIGWFPVGHIFPVYTGTYKIFLNNSGVMGDRISLLFVQKCIQKFV